MMTDFLARWAAENDENAKLVAQEMLITEVTEAIWEAMEEAGITKTELANRMGTTKGYVSQVLGGSRNMTLRTLSDICWSLRKKPCIAVEAKTDGVAWQTMSGARVPVKKSNIRYEKASNVIYPMDRWPIAA